MDFSTVCRTCLCDKDLNPIFSHSDDARRYSAAVLIAAGIKITPNDGLPQKMCTSCMYSLNNCLKFRKICKDTEQKLLKIKSELFQKETEPKITFVDAKTDLEELIDDKNEIKKESNELTVEVGPAEKLETSDDDEIKTEFTQVVFEEDDDKPLTYLLDTHSENDNTESNDTIFYKDNVVTDGKKFEDKKELLTPKSSRVTCSLCQKNLSVRSIDGHMARSHPGADARRVKCDLCDMYILKEKAGRHRKIMHGEEALKCGYCKTDFENKDNLIEHVTTCTAKRKKRKACESRRELLECDVCHKMMQKASLRMHKAIKHAGLGPVCEHCGRRFGNKFRLNEHYRAKHGYDKFRCSYCDFQSAGVMAMRNHERRHRGEKPFVCETCGAKFHAAYLLAQHKQSHRTEKLVKCDLCPASFKANNSLHMHKATCHSSALYKCSMCARAYSCRHYAVKHLRHVHAYTGPVPPLQRLTSEDGVAG